MLARLGHTREGHLEVREYLSGSLWLPIRRSRGGWQALVDRSDQLTGGGGHLRPDLLYIEGLMTGLRITHLAGRGIYH